MEEQQKRYTYKKRLLLFSGLWLAAAVLIFVILLLLKQEANIICLGAALWLLVYVLIFPPLSRKTEGSLWETVHPANRKPATVGRFVLMFLLLLAVQWLSAWMHGLWGSAASYLLLLFCCRWPPLVWQTRSGPFCAFIKAFPGTGGEPP